MPQNLHDFFCTNVRRRRLELGMTQAQLAAKLGVAPAYISEIEGGRNSPTITTIDRFAEALQINGAHLLTPPLEKISQTG